MSSYQHADAVAYARKYALTSNSSYPTFPNDCTNFVSQAMLAGGWTMLGDSFLDRADDRVWWYGKTRFTRASYTWAGAQNFANFVAASRRGIKAASPMDLEPGDVLQILEPATPTIPWSSPLKTPPTCFCPTTPAPTSTNP
jgi:Putative amidase domain